MQDPIDFPPNNTAPPCLIQPPQMWGGDQFPNVNKGEDRLREPPQGNEGTRAATAEGRRQAVVALPAVTAVRLRNAPAEYGGELNGSNS